MREFNAQEAGLHFYFVDRVAFAYNPIYLEIEALRPADIVVEIKPLSPTSTSVVKTLNVSVPYGRTSVYISRVIQTLFEDSKNNRSLNLSVSIREKSKEESFTSFDLLAIYGSIAPGERFYNLGAFHFDEESKSFEREVAYMPGFPFGFTWLNMVETPQLKIHSDISPTWKNLSDNVEISHGLNDIDINDLNIQFWHWVEVKGIVSDDENDVGVFDTKFDDTFHGKSAKYAYIKIKVQERQSGWYLRWIDHFGNYQYYLFTKGKSNIKVAFHKNTIARRCRVGGWEFEPSEEKNISDNQTVYCGCAECLPEKLFKEVSTIATASNIELYLGENREQEDLWCPVALESTSFDYRDKDILNRVEIKFRIPSFAPITK